MDQKIEAYFNAVDKWQKEVRKLREIVLSCDVTETYKWMHPCYTFDKHNIILIHTFIDHCALLFFKGALLKDSEQLLTQQTKNVQSARQIRFTSVAEILQLQSHIKKYIQEAIEIEKAGLKVTMKKTSDFDIPEELQDKFDTDPDFKIAFESLTPGRQKGYLLYFSQAKQSKTRMSRIETYQSRIVMGKGLRDCVCGLSKKMPNCDGSHKHIENCE